MARSNTEAWMNSGPNDLRTEEVVVDVPNKGDTVLVRALPAKYSAQVSSQMKMVQGGPGGRDQYATVDVAEMEALQFAHGVIEPNFTEEQARKAQENWGPTFRKIIARIDEISGVDKEAIRETRARFPSSEEGSSGPNGSDDASARGPEPDVSGRARPGVGDVDKPAR